MPEANSSATGISLLTNPELWLHLHHWECNEVTIAVVGVGDNKIWVPLSPLE